MFTTVMRAQLHADLIRVHTADEVWWGKESGGMWQPLSASSRHRRASSNER